MSLHVIEGAAIIVVILIIISLRSLRARRARSLRARPHANQLYSYFERVK